MSERILDHIGIAVPNLDDALPRWEPLVAAGATRRETVASQGVEVAFLGSGAGKIELLAPTRPDSAVARFLERRGSGLHHVAYRVADIRAALSELEAQGYQLIDAAAPTGRPRPPGRLPAPAQQHRSAGGARPAGRAPPAASARR